MFSLGLLFSTSVIVSYFTLFLGLTVSTIGSFLITELSGRFFLSFLRGIWISSVVQIAKLSSCLDKIETLKLSLWIFISEDFSILVLLLDKLFIGVDLDLYIEVSVLVLIFLEVLIVYLGISDFSVLLTVSIFFSEIGGGVGLFFLFCQTCQYSLLWQPCQ